MSQQAGGFIRRGEVWMVDLNPTRGHEQSGTRPALVVSVNELNRSPAELVIVVPITSKAKGIRTHVRLDPPEGGLSQISFAKCEDVRSISTQRMVRHLGQATPASLAQVEHILRIIMGL